MAVATARPRPCPCCIGHWVGLSDVKLAGTKQATKRKDLAQHSTSVKTL